MFRRDQWLHPATVLAALALMFSVGGVSYAAATIGTAQIKNKAVTGKKLANGAVTSKKIRDGAVVASKLGAGAVGAAALADGGVTTQKLSDGAITSSKLAGGSVGTGTLADEAVSTGKIAAQAVTAARLADGAVTGAKLADGAVSGAAIADGSVGLVDLDAGTVGDVLSKAGTMPNDGVQRDVLPVPGFGVVRVGCTATNANAFYAMDSPVSQRAHLFGHDPFDNNPIGAVSLNGTSGGLGFGGAMSIAEVTVWSFTDDRVLAVDISVSSGGTCNYRVRATLDRNGT